MLSPNRVFGIYSNGYKPLKELGRGAFGVAYLCRNRQNNLCCLKSISKDGGPSYAKASQNQRDEYVQSVQREIYLMSNLQHPRIVRCVEHFEMVDYMYIAMEYLASGNLQTIIRDRAATGEATFTVPHIVHYMCDMLGGVEYLHMKHVIHQDLKPANILLGCDGRLRIADFGMSRVHTDELKRVRQPGANGGTPIFMAPEALETGQYSFATDIWSLGCILHELCTLKSPFVKCRTLADLYAMALKRPSGTVRAMAEHWGDPRYGEWFQEMVDGMLAPVDRRMTIADLVNNSSLTKTFYANYFDYS